MGREVREQQCLPAQVWGTTAKHTWKKCCVFQRVQGARGESSPRPAPGALPTASFPCPLQVCQASGQGACAAFSWTRELLLAVSLLCQSDRYAAGGRGRAWLPTSLTQGPSGLPPTRAVQTSGHVPRTRKGQCAGASWVKMGIPLGQASRLEHLPLLLGVSLLLSKWDTNLG